MPTVSCAICGKYFHVKPSKIKRGFGRFCSNECRHQGHLKHGGRATRLYQIWRGIVTRCYNKKHGSFARYGLVGITMCAEWKDSFPAFREWALANGYADNLEIDRRENSGQYYPENCRWVPESIQSRNQRKRRGCSSRYKGVSWHKPSGKWFVQIQTNERKGRSLGYFSDEEEAARAYDKACRQYFPDTSVLNFPLAWIQESIDLYRPTCVI